MHAVIAWSGFLGAWLLVAGPLFQAAVDLEEIGDQRSGLTRAAQRVGPQPRQSPWWWLLPPVAYLRQRRLQRAYQQAVFEALTKDEVEDFIEFSYLSTGWAMVAFGAFFIAVKETYEVGELYEWPIGVFVGLVVLCIVLCALNTVVRMKRAHRMLADAETHPTTSGPVERTA